MSTETFHDGSTITTDPATGNRSVFGAEASREHGRRLREEGQQPFQTGDRVTATVRQRVYRRSFTRPATVTGAVMLTLLHLRLARLSVQSPQRAYPGRLILPQWADEGRRWLAQGLRLQPVRFLRLQ